MLFRSIDKDKLLQAVKENLIEILQDLSLTEFEEDCTFRVERDSEPGTRPLTRDELARLRAMLGDKRAVVKPVFFCPNCHATSDQVTFEIVKMTPVYWPIKPHIGDHGQVSYEYIKGVDGNVDWDGGEVEDCSPYIRCPACNHFFYPDEFAIKEEATTERAGTQV